MWFVYTLSIHVRDILVKCTFAFHVRDVTWAQQIKDPPGWWQPLKKFILHLKNFAVCLCVGPGKLSIEQVDVLLDALDLLDLVGDGLTLPGNAGDVVQDLAGVQRSANECNCRHWNRHIRWGSKTLYTLEEGLGRLQASDLIRNPKVHSCWSKNYQDKGSPVTAGVFVKHLHTYSIGCTRSGWCNRWPNKKF